jgi:DNA-binding CsgD family transcriptional regulator
MNDISALIDQIYEAAFMPDRWHPILEGLTKVAGGHGTALFNPGRIRTHVLTSPSLNDMHHKMQVEGWAERNTRAARLMSIPHAGFVDEALYFTEQEVRTQPIFTEVLRPLGYGFGTSTFIKVPTGESIIIAVEKKAATGPVTQAAIALLDQLRPHLARAAMLSSRLEFERVNAAVATLQMTGLPSAVLSHDGKVIAANQLLEDFAPSITIAAHDFVRFEYAPANRLMTDILDLARKSAALESRSFPLPRLADRQPAVVHLVPIRGSARDIFLSAAFFLIVTPVDRSKVPTAETIQGLFDLTAAEARVAHALAAGNDVAATAQQLSVGVETVRTHVKGILTKSGMTRQSDFIATVASIRPLP